MGFLSKERDVVPLDALGAEHHAERQPRLDVQQDVADPVVEQAQVPGLDEQRDDRQRQELISKPARLAYPIRDGIPVMLEEEARRLEPSEYE